VPDLPSELRAALTAAAEQYPASVLAAVTTRLIARYQDGAPAVPGESVLRSDSDAVAYATYRMPATYAAVHAALGALAGLVPEFTPNTHLDVGGGTGAAMWAAAALWPGMVSHRVIDEIPAVIELGRRLAAGSTSAAVRGARWQRADLAEDPELPPADLVTVSYVLGELAADPRAALLAQLAQRLVRSSGVLVLVEPGSVAGFARILAARASVLAAGMRVVAPCPHAGPCPMGAGGDWCHFSARLPRSSAHRRAKGAARGFEDEKFSYLVASTQPGARAQARVVRHPQLRKGVVSLQLCGDPPGLRAELVSKRQGEHYRAARRANWGDAWPPTT